MPTLISQTGESWTDCRVLRVGEGWEEYHHLLLPPNVHVCSGLGKALIYSPICSDLGESHLEELPKGNHGPGHKDASSRVMKFMVYIGEKTGNTPR